VRVRATPAMTVEGATVVMIARFHGCERFSWRMISSLLMHVGQLAA